MDRGKNDEKKSRMRRKMNDGRVKEEKGGKKKGLLERKKWEDR